jgi:DNA-binding response OmpR family regulator
LGEIIERILYFGKAVRDAEVLSAEDFCDAVQVFAIMDDYTAYLDDTKLFYNAVIVSGTDAVRICKFMRINRPLLNNKAKIASLRTASSENRAKILNCGYDDVFHDKMLPVERKARLQAIVARFDRATEEATLQSAFDLHMRHYVHEPLKGRESRVMTLLLAARGGAVPGYRLAATSRAPRPAMSEKSLQVLISVLRSKLKDHVVLEYHEDEGYSLHPVLRDNEADLPDTSRKLG